MGSGMQQHGWLRVFLASLLILLAAVVLGGCKQVQQVQEVLHNSQPPAVSRGERLIAYEQGGNIWTIEATGDGAQQVNKTGNLMLGSWAPEASKMAVLSGINQNGEWVTGNAGVLDLNGNLQPVMGPQGAITIEPGEASWLDSNSLVLGGLGAIWVARLDGSQYRATALYTAKHENSEQVWHPKAVPGGSLVSFWVTSTEGTEGDVTARLVIAPVAGGQATTIFSQTILASGQAPVDAIWAPDGRYILIYAEPTSGGNPWWMLDRTKGSKKQVLSADAGDVQWLPGDQLIYAPQAQLQVPKYALLDAATGESKPFIAIPSWVNWLQVASDNRLLLARATGDNSINWDYYVAAADGSNVKKIITAAGDAAWQP
ncbi:MAG: hypothetical protein ABSC17_06980 [Thermacetogeniaceae bacterium]